VLRYSMRSRAAALNSATSITPEMLARIEWLHRRADRSAAALPTQAAAVVKAVQRWFTLGVTKGRSSASRRAEDLG